MILLDSMGRYPQKIHETESLDIEVLIGYLNAYGYEVITKKYHQFLDSINSIDCSEYDFLYASSQYKEYKSYIEDILLYIVSNGGRIIPNFQLFRSHENKAFQELYKLMKNIPTPNFNIVGTFEEGVKVLQDIDYPVIGKTISGFGSKGVVKINNFSEGIRFLYKNMVSGVQFNYEGLRVLARRLKYKNLYPKKSGSIVLQEMIEGIDHDWKILVFGNICFCLKRCVRKNDFRASGSGMFDFDAVPNNKILDFAYAVKNKLDTPWVSLDIIYKNNICYLIEYQTVHFGLTTLINNSYYYKYNELAGEWKKKVKNEECEYFFAKALDDYISTKPNLNGGIKNDSSTHCTN